MKRNIYRALGVVLVFFSAAFSALAADLSKEPKDFRGIRWGQSVDSLSGMQLQYGDDATGIYTKKDDELTYGDANLEKIEYVFINGNLFRVSLIAKGYDNGKNMLDEARREFGTETAKTDGQAVWKFADTAVFFMVEEELDQCVLFYRYMVDIP